MAAVTIHEPFEIKVANEFVRKAAPYLKMMRSVVMVAKFAATCAGLPIPFAIPNLPDMFDSDILSNIEAVVVENIFNEDNLNAVLDDRQGDADNANEVNDITKEKTTSNQFTSAAERLKMSKEARQWNALMTKHVGTSWVDETCLRQAVVPSTGRVYWVCERCFQKRWEDLCTTEIAPVNATGRKNVAGMADTNGDGDVEDIAVDPDLAQFVRKVLRPRNRVDEIKLRKVCNGLYKHSVRNLAQLLMVDIMWRMDGEFSAVRSFICSPEIGFTQPQASAVIQAIQLYRTDAHLTDMDSGCSALIKDFARVFAADEQKNVMLSATISAWRNCEQLSPLEFAQVRGHALLTASSS